MESTSATSCWPRRGAIGASSQCNRGYDDQFAEVAALAGAWQATIWSETNGSRRACYRAAREAGHPCAGESQFSTQRDKEAAYSRLNMMLETRSIVLPDDPELLRQLGGVSASLTPSGGMHIEARLEPIHDDLPDALTLAVSRFPAQLPVVPAAPIPDGVTWAETTGQVKVPVPFVTLRPEHAWDSMYGGVWRCAECHAPVPAYREAYTTSGCTGSNPELAGTRPPAPDAPPRSALGVEPAAAVPAGNSYART